MVVKSYSIPGWGKQTELLVAALAGSSTRPV